MRLVGLSLLLLLLTSIAYAELPNFTCSADRPVTISDRDGVTIKTVTIVAPSGKLNARVFVPGEPGPLAGIAFSHSSIQYADSRTDLFSFARALARAGAASIMLDGTIDWRTPNDDSNRPWEDVSCAAQWLMANVKLDLQRLAIAGPIALKGDPFCPILGEQPCGYDWFHFNFGYTENNSYPDFTTLMKTPQGQLPLTVLPKGFRLRQVKLQWLMDTTDR